MSGMDDLINYFEKEKAKSIKEKKNAGPGPNERRSKWTHEIYKFYRKVIEEWISELIKKGLRPDITRQTFQVKDPDIKAYYRTILKLILPGEKCFVVISPKEIGQIEISGPVKQRINIMLRDDGKWYTNDTPLDKDTFLDLIKSVTSSE